MNINLNTAVTAFNKYFFNYFITIEKKELYFLIYSSTEQCQVQPFWALKLHTHLRSLKPDDLFIEDLQDLLVNLEFCKMCNKSFGNCRNEKCDDIFAYLLKLNPHFQSLRTLTRRLYEIRSINIWIMEINLILQGGCLTSLKRFIAVDSLKVY